MDIFIVKKVASMLVMPLPLTLIFMLLTLIYLFRNQVSKAKVWLTAATLVLLSTSLPPLPEKLLGDREQQFRQFDPSQRIDAIVILGGGHENDGAMPLTSQLGAASIYRVAEAVRLAHLYPNVPIYTAGGGRNNTFAHAEMIRRMLIAMGLPKSRVHIGTDRALDTEEEARMLASVLKAKQFALVTSASHMERAVRLFKAQGLQPVAAPTEHLVKRGDNPVDWWKSLPHSTNIYKFERWWYEAMGNTWLSLKALFA